MKRAWNDTRKYGEVPRGLMMLGVRLYPMEDKILAVQTDIRSMQKSLYGQKDWFYFYNGVSIKDQEGGGYESSSRVQSSRGIASQEINQKSE